MSDLSKRLGINIDLRSFFSSIFKKKKKEPEYDHDDHKDEPKDRDSVPVKHYYKSPPVSGPGYPGVKEIIVYVNKHTFRDASGTEYVSRWEEFEEAVKVWQPIVTRAGKSLSISYDPSRSHHIAGPFWNSNRTDKHAYTGTDGNIYFYMVAYFKSKKETFKDAVHEIGHGLGMPHSGEPSDVMYRSSTSAELTERDINTCLMMLKD